MLRWPCSSAVVVWRDLRGPTSNRDGCVWQRCDRAASFPAKLRKRAVPSRRVRRQRIWFRWRVRGRRAPPVGLDRCRVVRWQVARLCAPSARRARHSARRRNASIAARTRPARLASLRCAARVLSIRSRAWFARAPSGPAPDFQVYFLKPHAAFPLNNFSLPRSSRCAYVPSVSRKENGSTFMCRDAPERPIYRRSELLRLHVFNHLQRFLIAEPCIRNIDLDPSHVEARPASSGTKSLESITLATYELPCIAQKGAAAYRSCNSFGGGTDVTLLRTILSVAGFARWLSVSCLRATYTIIRVRSVEPLLIQHYVRRKAWSTAWVGHPFGEDSILFGIDTSQSIDSKYQRDERG